MLKLFKFCARDRMSIRYLLEQFVIWILKLLATNNSLAKRPNASGNTFSEIHVNRTVFSRSNVPGKTGILLYRIYAVFRGKCRHFEKETFILLKLLTIHVSICIPTEKKNSLFSELNSAFS